MGKWLTGLMILVCTCHLSAQDRDISFFNIFDGSFTTSSVNNLDWMQDGQYYTRAVRLNNGVEIRKFDILSGSFDVIVTSEQLISAFPDAGQIEDYQFSRNEQFLLLNTDIEPLSEKDQFIHVETDLEPLWRSYKANYFVYDRTRAEFLKLGNSGKKQQYVDLSPDGNRAAYVQDGNLYWMDLETGEIIQITDDGDRDSIINGAADWVYREEFGFAKGWAWSPDGKKIAFYRFDELNVNDYSLTEWDGTYPGEISFKYPKAGQDNADVSIGIYRIESDNIIWAELPDNFEYIPRINWTRHNETLAVRTLNRLQNHLQLFLINTETGSSTMFWEHRDEAWIDIDNNLRFISDNHSFIYTSDRDGYNHLYLFDSETRESNQITKGNWEVTEFIGYDMNENWLYYISTEESPLERHLFRIKIDGVGKEKLSDKPGWNQVDMSPDFRFFIHSNSTINTPPIYTLRSSDGSIIRMLEDNKNAFRTLERFQVPQFTFEKIQLKEAGELNAMMVTPPDFDPEKSYPLLMYVYGGPGSQTVTNSFRTDHKHIWHYYLASKGYIIVSVDSRGTGGRGRNFKKQIHGKLGYYETADQIEAAKYFSKRKYIDENRIGIWGWSYGGYISTLALAEGSDIFSLAIAVAPVTHWEYYNTIYTERYMQTPELNRNGYESSAPVNKADEIIGNYLLIHGTADEYVHFQNAVDMVDALVRNNIQFQTMFYPNRNHSIHGGNTRLHMFRMMTDFIEQNL
jgi:dipeptidyl-peptidase 4